jgi:hypothetical protein
MSSQKTGDAIALIGMLIRLGIDIKETGEAIKKDNAVTRDQLRWAIDDMTATVDKFHDEFGK